MYAPFKEDRRQEKLQQEEARRAQQSGKGKGDVKPTRPSRDNCQFCLNLTPSVSDNSHFEKNCPHAADVWALLKQTSEAKSGGKGRGGPGYQPKEAWDGRVASHAFHQSQPQQSRGAALGTPPALQPAQRPRDVRIAHVSQYESDVAGQEGEYDDEEVRMAYRVNAGCTHGHITTLSASCGGTHSEVMLKGRIGVQTGREHVQAF